MIRTVSENSLTVSVIKKYTKYYRAMEYRLDRAFKYSATYRFIETVHYRMRSLFEHSAIFGALDIKESREVSIAGNNRTYRLLCSAIQAVRSSIAKSLTGSTWKRMAADIKEELSSDAVKKIGLTCIMAVSINMFLVILTKREIGMFGWIMRAVFLFTWIVTLASKCTRREMINASIIARFIDKHEKR